MLLRVRDELLRECVCLHQLPLDPRCKTCRLIHNEIGFAQHCELLMTSPSYAHAWGRRLKTEIQMFRILRLVPWVDLANDVVFFWHAYGAIIFGMAIAHNEHGSYKHASLMCVDAAIACASYLLSLQFQKWFA